MKLDSIIEEKSKGLFDSTVKLIIHYRLNLSRNRNKIKSWCGVSLIVIKILIEMTVLFLIVNSKHLFRQFQLSTSHFCNCNFQSSTIYKSICEVSPMMISKIHSFWYWNDYWKQKSWKQFRIWNYFSIAPKM